MKITMQSLNKLALAGAAAAILASAVWATGVYREIVVDGGSIKLGRKADGYTRAIITSTGNIIAERVAQKDIAYMDDFMEGPDAVANTVVTRAHWTDSGTSGSTRSISNTLAGGMLVLNTTTTTDSYAQMLFRNSIGDLVRNPQLQVRARLSSTTSQRAEIGLRAASDLNDYVFVTADTSVNASRWLLRYRKAGGTVGTLVLPVNIDAQFRTWTITCLANGAVEVSEGTRIVGKLPAGSIATAAVARPLIQITTLTGSTRTMVVDYVAFWQDR